MDSWLSKEAEHAVGMKELYHSQLIHILAHDLIHELWDDHIVREHGNKIPNPDEDGVCSACLKFDNWYEASQGQDWMTYRWLTKEVK